METPQPLFSKLPLFKEPELKEALLKHGQLLAFNKGDVIVKTGQYVRFLPIVLKGSIRVFQQKEDREVSLYYVRSGETCTMSLAAAYFNNKSVSHGVVMEPTEVLIFPANFLTEWQLQFPSWNQYIITMFRKRYDELINTFEGVVFDHINVRVMEYLKRKSLIEESRIIDISHQTLAKELGTTRVVISRILKQFEREKKVKLLRGQIEIK
ncbi:MAG: Crp/Fnr family transcriptional regulator [Sphingobacteriia bacterium]|nr:Crp/Fnr family transcriptional regulator [Sphingobacteriia bacterium]